MRSSQTLLSRHRDELARRDQDFAAAQERQVVLGRLLTELFRLPPGVVADVLDPERIPSLAESAEELERVRGEFQRLAEASPGLIIKHLLTFDEIRKRCDIWELHIQASPRRLILLDPARQQHELTLPLVDVQPGAPLDAAAFELLLYTQLKSWPQPKSLVEVIFTYAADVRINIRDDAQVSILNVLDRLRAEFTGRTRFEFADFGIPVP